MTTIRVIYDTEPSFPATDQHPLAVRFHIGSVWVDAVGGVPVQADVDAVLTPSAGIDNYRAMIRRRADTLQRSGDQIGALLLLKTIGD